MATQNNARKAIANAKTNVNKAGQPGRVLETVKPKAVEVPQDFVGRMAKVVKGRKNKDEIVSVFHVPAKPNKFNKINAICIDQDGERVYIDVTYLEDTGKTMDAKLLKQHQDARQAEADETVYVAAHIKVSMDKKSGEPESVQLRNSGWFAPIWFGVSQVVTTDAVTEDNLSIVEVPAWKIRTGAGKDALDKIRDRQDEYTALVEGK